MGEESEFSCFYKGLTVKRVAIVSMQLTLIRIQYMNKNDTYVIYVFEVGDTISKSNSYKNSSSFSFFNFVILFKQKINQ